MVNERTVTTQPSNTGPKGVCQYALVASLQPNILRVLMPVFCKG